MKKLPLSLIALLLILSLSACSAQPFGQFFDGVFGHTETQSAVSEAEGASVSASEAEDASSVANEAVPAANGRFKCVYGGAVFYVPEGFEQTEPPYDPAAGYVYAFYHPDLDAKIEVSEIAAAALPTSVEDALTESYVHLSDDPGMTYCADGDGWCVVSGYNEDRTQIYYTKCMCGGDDFFYQFYMTYPTANRADCDPIVIEFERTFCR